MTVSSIAEHRSGEDPDVDGELVGRREERDRLEGQILGRNSLVTLIGPPGVGKTHLLAAVCRGLRDGPIDETLRLDLRDVDTVAALRTAVARALGVETSAPFGDRLALALSSRESFLLVLDHADGLTQSDDTRRSFGEQLRTWHESAPELCVVVGARRRIADAREQCHDLAPLEPSAGMELFERRARRVRSDFAVDPSNRDSVRRIVEELDGLPQAIELAAARCRILGPEEILERIRREQTDGNERPNIVEPLERALAESWSDLPEWARDAAAQLGVFRGSFSVGAAHEILELGTDAPTEVDVLEHLVDSSLLETSPTTDGAVRFSMLTTVRRFVDRQTPSVTDRDEHGGAEDRHARYYAERCRQFWRRRGTADAPNSQAAFDRIRPQIEAAFGRAVDRSWPSAIALGAGLVVYHSDRDRHRAASDLLDRLDRGDIAPPDPWSDAVYPYMRAYIAVSAGDVAGARSHIRDARSRADAADDLDVLGGRIEVVAALGASMSGEIETALDHLEMARERFQNTGGAVDRAKLLLQFGRIHRGAGRQTRAETHIREALETADNHGLPSQGMRARLHLALLYCELENFEQALEHAEAAVELNDELPPWKFESLVPAVAGSIYYAAGKLEFAETLYAKGIRAKRREGALGLLASALAEFGFLLLERDRPGDARQKFLESRRLAPESHFGSGPDLYGTQLVGIALSYALEDRLESARDALIRAEERLEDLTQNRPDEPSPEVLAHIVNFGRCVVELRTLRANPDASEDDPAATLRRAEERIQEALKPTASFVKFIGARRIASRELRRSRERFDDGESDASERRHLRIGDDFRWLEVDGDSRQDLSRRGPLRKVLACLVEARRDSGADGRASRSVYELMEAGWPDQTADPESGKNRVYTTVARLRDMGLDEILQTVDDGYRLHPDVTVEHAPDRES